MIRPTIDARLTLRGHTDERLGRIQSSFPASAGDEIVAKCIVVEIAVNICPENPPGRIQPRTRIIRGLSHVDLIGARGSIQLANCLLTLHHGTGSENPEASNAASYSGILDAQQIVDRQSEHLIAAANADEY